MLKKIILGSLIFLFVIVLGFFVFESSAYTRLKKQCLETVSTKDNRTLTLALPDAQQANVNAFVSRARTIPGVVSVTSLSPDELFAQDEQRRQERPIHAIKIGMDGIATSTLWTLSRSLYTAHQIRIEYATIADAASDKTDGDLQRFAQESQVQIGRILLRSPARSINRQLQRFEKKSILPHIPNAFISEEAAIVKLIIEQCIDGKRIDY